MNWYKKLLLSFLSGVAISGLQAASVTKLTTAKVAQATPVSSIWEQLAQGKILSPQEKRQLFINDCRSLAAVNATIPAHTKNNSAVRIATYNVHDWKDPIFKPNYDGIMRAIKAVNADVLVVQEVLMFDAHKIYTDFQAMGYPYATFCPKDTKKYGQSGNLIVSKYPFAAKPYKQFYAIDKDGKEKMNFIKVEVVLPNNTNISVCGTYIMHTVRGEEHRIAELQELIKAVQADTNKNKIILADFNAIRAKDYNYDVAGKKVWDLMIADDKQRSGIETPTLATQLLEKQGWQDSFAKAGVPGPKYTVWPGKVVDYVWMTNEWQLPVVGSYVYYDAASDHLPILVDIQIGAFKPAVTTPTTQRTTPTLAFFAKPELQKKVRERWGKEIDKYRDTIIKPLLHNEARYGTSHYVFYHSQQTLFQLIHDITKELYVLLGKGDVPNDFIFLRPWQDGVEQKTVNEFIEAEENGDYNKRWYNRAKFEQLLSVNLALFGNLDRDGECTFHYFLKNYSVNAAFETMGLRTPQEIAQYLVEKTLKRLGLSTKYAAEMSKLVDMLSAQTGNLYQIFIPKNKVDDYVYACHGSGKFGFGTPYRINDLSKDPVIRAAYDATKRRYTKISPILDTYCNNPAAIPNINLMQARIVFVPDMLDPRSGVKIFRYSTIKPEGLAEYQQKLSKICKEIVATSPIKAKL